MQNDLDKQRQYAHILAYELSADLDTEEITANLILDLLGVCGLVLQQGTDAGKAWVDDIVNEAK
jgi:hypothetical protein